MAAMDLPPSESESGSDAEAPGVSHNPNRPDRCAMSLWLASRLIVGTTMRVFSPNSELIEGQNPKKLPE